MNLRLNGVCVLISSFGDEDDNGEKYIYNLKYVKAGRQYLYFNRPNF